MCVIICVLISLIKIIIKIIFAAILEPSVRLTTLNLLIIIIIITLLLLLLLYLLSLTIKNMISFTTNTTIPLTIINRIFQQVLLRGR